MKFIRLEDNVRPLSARFIDSLLKRNMKNDKLLESWYFKLRIKADSPIQLFYRTLWCDLYLRRFDHDRNWATRPEPEMFCDVMEDAPEGEYNVYLSLSECLQYINAVTPPRLKDQIPENTSSIKKIYDLMHFFLFEDVNDKSQQVKYMTEFYRVFHFEIFDNGWEPDFKKIAFMRENIKTYDIENYGTFIGSVDASSVSLDQIIKDGPHPNASLQMTFHADTDEDIQLLYEFLEMNDFTILNLYCDENVGFFVSAYVYGINVDIVNFVESIYSELLKK